MRTLEEWTALFAKLGVKDPVRWAECEVSEDLGNLPRLAFLKRVWEEIPRSEDAEWVANWVGHARRNRSESHIVSAYERMSSAGASDADLATLLRGVMGQFLFRLSYILDDNGHDDEELEAAASWGLYHELDVEEPVRRLGCIHELVFSVDPEANGG
jgi:hypothetical protein